MGLSEKGGSTAFNGCKHVCVDAHTQGNIGLFCEGPSNLLSPRMDCALKENERSEPKSFWEVGESSKGAEWVLDPVRAQGNTSLFCEGPTNFGLGCALKENKRSGPKLFWEVGQSSKGVERVSDPNQAFLDEPLKKGRASVFQMLSKGWFAEEFLVGEMGSEEIEGFRVVFLQQTRALWMKLPGIPSFRLLLFAFGGDKTLLLLLSLGWRGL